MLNNKQLLMRIVPLFLLIWGLWTLRLAAPFYGLQDGFRVWIPASVHNYDQYDRELVGWMVTRNLTPVTTEADLVFYSHHPPLVTWLPYGLSRVAGFNEVTLRFVFAAAMMLALSGFYVLVRRLYHARMALWAVFFFGVVPMIAYFQPSYGHDPLGLMAGLLFAAVFVNWYREPNTARYLALAGLMILTVLSAWPGVFLAAFFAMPVLFTGNWRHRSGVVLLGIISVMAFAGLMLFYEAQHSGSIASLMDAYVWRTSSLGGGRTSESISPLQWLAVNMAHLIFFGSLGLLLLALWGAGIIYRQRSQPQRFFILWLLIGGIAYLVAFRNASYIHDYYKAFLIPAMAIAAAAVMVYQSRRQRLARIVVGTLFGVTLVQSLSVLAIMVLSTRQPDADAIIDYIQGHPGESVTLIYPDATLNFVPPIEFYTGQPITLNDSDLEADIVIYCHTDALPTGIDGENIGSNCKAFPQAGQSLPR